MFNASLGKTLFLAATALPALANPFGWNAEFSRKLEITSPAPCKLTLKQKMAGLVQVMHLENAAPVVETLSEAGDSVDIAKAVSGTWWIGFQTDNQGQMPTSPNPGIDLDLELSAPAAAPAGKVRLPFHVSCQLEEPKVLVDVRRKLVDSRVLSGSNCTYVKAPFAVVQKTKEQDLMIKISD
jgi:hypothetical protein